MSALTDYHISIGEEIRAAQSRVRKLLSPTIHWGEDGRSKEDVLKFVLSRHAPQTVGIYSGFVRLKEKSSSQIDILLTDRTKPMLFSTNDFCITTPSNVFGIVEVKTKINSLNALKEILEKQVNDLSEIRRYINEDKFSYSSSAPWCGLFSYEKSNLKTDEVLEILDQVADKSFHRACNMICLGPDTFIRFWPEDGSWRAYNLEKLAYSYFIGNLIWQDSQASALDQASWFALQEGKDSKQIGNAKFLTRI